MAMVSDRTVSVVLATYNGSRFISEQIESLLKQTFQPTQLIVSDDCSRDGTLSIVEKLVRDSCIKIEIIRNNPAYGFRDNFLRAAMQATGDFIAFCDQDDVWSPLKLERCSSFFDQEAVSLIVHKAITIDENSKEIGAFSQGIKKTAVKPPLSYDPWMTFFGFSMVFRREVLHLADNFTRFVDFIQPSHRVAHDRWIIFLSQMVGKTVEINEPLVGYRQHTDNAFGDGTKKRDLNNSDIVRRSDDYISATLAMIKIVANMPTETTAVFPEFDRDKALFFLRRACEQLEARNNIYVANTSLSAWREFLSCVKNDRYTGVHSGEFRWRSLARDLHFLLSGG
jgi:glycosyltransferase involved in cell wall biosynthesis